MNIGITIRDTLITLGIIIIGTIRAHSEIIVLSLILDSFFLSSAIFFAGSSFSSHIAF